MSRDDEDMAKAMPCKTVDVFVNERFEHLAAHSDSAGEVHMVRRNTEPNIRRD